MSLPRPRTLLVTLLAILVAACTPKPLPPIPGLLEAQEIGSVAVPGGIVEVTGRNLMVRRVDLSIDTRLGTHELGATYNSANDAWLWSFDVTYDGATFVDPTGAVHDVTGLTAGDAIPGTVWRMVDADTIQTKGGLTHEFAPTGRLAAIHWLSADYPRLEFVSSMVAGAERTTSIQQCTAPGSCLEFFDISYDGVTGDVTAVDDRAGRRAEFTYGAPGQLDVAKDGLDVAEGWPGFRYEYVGGRMSAMTNSEGERIEYRYDVANHLIELEAIDPAGPGPVWTFVTVAPSSGQRYTNVTNPDGEVTRFTHDGQRRISKRIAGVGTLDETTTYAWDGRRPTSMTDPAGVTTTYSYVDDDLATRTEPSGNVVSYTYASLGENRRDPNASPVASITDSLGLVESRTYEVSGRLESVTNGAGDTTQFAWGSLGELTTLTEPDGVVVTFSSYGEHGHAGLIVRGSEQDSPTYDLVGNVLTGHALEGPVAPGLGGIVSRSFDADRNLSGVVLAGLVDHIEAQQPYTLAIENRSDRRPRRFLRPFGGDTELVYDALGRMVERREKASDTGHATWQSFLYEYDGTGRALSMEQPNGMKKTISLDDAGRVETLTHAWGAAIEGQLVITYASGRVVSVSDTAHPSPESYDYDSAGRISGVTYPGGERLERVYDLRSRASVDMFLTSPLPGGTVIRTLGLRHDLADRLVEVCEGADCIASGSPLFERTYLNGSIDSLAYGNGILRTFGYDGATGRLQSSQSFLGETQIETSSSLRLAGVAGPVPYANTQIYGTVAAVTSEQAQLTAAPVVGGGTAGLRMVHGNAIQNTYDALSNIDSVAGHACGTGSWAEGNNQLNYNTEKNRLLSITSSCAGADVAYQYDEAGFVVDRDGVALAWNAAGQIESIGSSTSFVWDSVGRPVTATLEGIEIHWSFGGRMETTASGVPVAIDMGEVRIDLLNDEHVYRHLDYRGNIKFETDHQGDVVAVYGYAGFGRTVSHGTEGLRGFARGYEMEGFVLLGGRLHEPLTGRFLAPDPVYQLISQYSYALGNPFDLWDPSGFVHGPIGKAGQVMVAAATALGFAAGIQAVTNPPGAVATGAGAGAIGLVGMGLLALDAIIGDDPAYASSSSSSSACSPTVLSRRPAPLWLLAILVPIQIGLAIWVLRGRRWRVRPLGSRAPEIELAER